MRVWGTPAGVVRLGAGELRLRWCRLIGPGLEADLVRLDPSTAAKSGAVWVSQSVIHDWGAVVIGPARLGTLTVRDSLIARTQSLVRLDRGHEMAVHKELTVRLSRNTLLMEGPLLDTRAVEATDIQANTNIFSCPLGVWILGPRGDDRWRGRRNYFLPIAPDQGWLGVVDRVSGEVSGVVGSLSEWRERWGARDSTGLDGCFTNPTGVRSGPVRLGAYRLRAHVGLMMQNHGGPAGAPIDALTRALGTPDRDTP